MDAKTYTSEDIANALIRIMTMANFSGFIEQPQEGPFLQFCPGTVEAKGDLSRFALEFGGCDFEVIIETMQ